MANPDQVSAAVRAATKPDGVWFIADMDGEPPFRRTSSAIMQSASISSITVEEKLTSYASSSIGRA